MRRVLSIIFFILWDCLFNLYFSFVTIIYGVKAFIVAVKGLSFLAFIKGVGLIFFVFPLGLLFILLSGAFVLSKIHGDDN